MLLGIKGRNVSGRDGGGSESCPFPKDRASHHCRPVAPGLQPRISIPPDRLAARFRRFAGGLLTSIIPWLGTCDSQSRGSSRGSSSGEPVLGKQKFGNASRKGERAILASGDQLLRIRPSQPSHHGELPLRQALRPVSAEAAVCLTRLRPLPPRQAGSPDTAVLDDSGPECDHHANRTRESPRPRVPSTAPTSC